MENIHCVQQIAAGKYDMQHLGNLFCNMEFNPSILPPMMTMTSAISVLLSLRSQLIYRVNIYSHLEASSTGTPKDQSVYNRDPFNQHGLNSIPIWISDYIHYKVCGKIIDPFPNFKVQPFKFGNKSSYHT